MLDTLRSGALAIPNLNSLLATGSTLLTYCQSTLLFILQHFSSAAGSAINFFVSLSLFLMCLFYLLASKRDFLALVIQMLPGLAVVGCLWLYLTLCCCAVSDQSGRKISHTLTRAVKGVFAVNLQVSLFHACFTWISFRWFGVHFVYLSTVCRSCLSLIHCTLILNRECSGVLGLIPFMPAWLVSIPAALELWAHGYPFLALVFAASGRSIVAHLLFVLSA